MKKDFKFYVIIIIVIAIIVSFFVLKFSKNDKVDQKEQKVFELTYNVSKEYLRLRYQTDLVLTEAKKYESYQAWNEAMTETIADWTDLGEKVLVLHDLSEKLANPNLSYLGVPSALAYEKSEVTAIFDSAPAGKKIVTLAKHLGVDIKKAVLILQQDQNQVTADAWNEAGDTLQNLETSATVIKDGCKVAGFVGGIVVTGGVSAVAVGSTLAKATVLVSGADLLLEVSDDAAKIALGNHNKVSGFLGDIKKVTEPVATILNINEIPKNLATGYQKFTSVMVGIEQFNSAAQEGKVLGVELPDYKDAEKFTNIKKYKTPVYISKLSKEDVDTWLDEKKAVSGEFSPEELAQFLRKEKKDLNKNSNATSLETSLENSATSSLENSTSTTEISEKNLEKNPEDDLENISEEKTSENNESSAAASFSLSLKPVSASNDWQANIKNELFKQAVIEVKNNVFSISSNISFSEGKFDGSGSIKLEGVYDPASKTLSGKHYREYKGNYKGEPRSIVYSGSFKQVIPEKGSEVKISFSGQLQDTATDGKGKPYTTTSEAGVNIVYIVK